MSSELSAVNSCLLLLLLASSFGFDLFSFGALVHYLVHVGSCNSKYPTGQSYFIFDWPRKGGLRYDGVISLAEHEERGLSNSAKFRKVAMRNIE